MLCQRIPGVVVPRDIETFDAQNLHVITQLEQLRKFVINAGQLLDHSMEQRGDRALAIFTSFMELMNVWNGDFSMTRR